MSKLFYLILASVFFVGVLLATIVYEILHLQNKKKREAANEILLKTLEELRAAEETAQQERVKAYAANQAKSSFLANVSHEIRTPINAVIGMNEMILRESTEENVKEYAMDVNAAGMQLLSIINDILDISKIEAGKMEVIQAEYDLGEMIHDLVNMIEVKAREKGLTFDVEVDSNLPKKLFGDDLRLKQIIVNLLSNGVKYTKEGGVKLKIDGRKQDQELELHVEVVDTGIGIKDEEMDNLFKAFHRLDERTNRTIEGTGLGMSIANELLNMMGSTIEVESEYGKGSRFHFTVAQRIMDETPIGDIEATIRNASKSYSHTIKFTATDAKLLVVDDNSINRKVVMGLLKEIGCSIDEASGGYECIEKVKEKAYDLIFLDHLMPDLDGVGTMEKIKSEENLNMNTPVIAFTANAISGMRESFLATGFNGFISKPVAADKLEEILLEFLPKELIKETEIVFSKEASENEPSLKNLDDFDFRYARMCLGKNELILSVAKDFYDSIERIRRKLNEYMENLESDEVVSFYRTDVHALKSTSRMLGEFTLSGLAKTAEDGAKAFDRDKIRILHPLIMAELERAESELEELLPKEEEQNRSDISNEELEARLKELLGALEDRNVGRCDELAGQLREFSFSSELEPKMQELFEYIKLIKMLKASKQIEDILEVLRR